jgi:hypothetical protein
MVVGLREKALRRVAESVPGVQVGDRQNVHLLAHHQLVTEQSVNNVGTAVRLGYISSNAEFNDPEVIAKIAQHPDSGYLGRLMFKNETWASPDFRPWGRLIRLGIQPVWDEVIPRFVSIHHA